MARNEGMCWSFIQLRLGKENCSSFGHRKSTSNLKMGANRKTTNLKDLNLNFWKTVNIQISKLEKLSGSYFYFYFCIVVQINKNYYRLSRADDKFAIASNGEAEEIVAWSVIKKEARWNINCHILQSFPFFFSICSSDDDGDVHNEIKKLS